MCHTGRTVGKINKSEDDIFLVTVNASADTQSVQQDHHGYVVDLTLNGHSVQFKIDTGADVTVIRETE